MTGVTYFEVEVDVRASRLAGRPLDLTNTQHGMVRGLTAEKTGDGVQVLLEVPTAWTGSVERAAVTYLSDLGVAVLQEDVMGVRIVKDRAELPEWVTGTDPIDDGHGKRWVLATVSGTVTESEADRMLNRGVKYLNLSRSVVSSRVDLASEDQQPGRVFRVFELRIVLADTESRPAESISESLWYELTEVPGIRSKMRRERLSLDVRVLS